MSIVSDNLLKDKNYRPYCGNFHCRDMPRVKETGILQFVCPCCGWKSNYSKEFIDEYKKKHNL